MKTNNEFGMTIGEEYRQYEPIERIIVREAQDKLIDKDGFRNSNCRPNGRTVLTMRQLLEREGGFIVGEGDVGKTTYAHMLLKEAEKLGAAHLLSFREFSQEDAMLSRIERLITLDTNRKMKRITIILDGLDEVERLASIVPKLCDKQDHCIRFWLTSRPCMALSNITRKPRRFGQCYMILPLSRNEAMQIAGRVKVDGKDFFAAVNETQILSFASKTGGLRLLLELFANNKFRRVARWDLFKEIAIMLVRKSRDGLDEPSNGDKFDINELLDASAWIATCFFLSDVKSTTTIGLGKSHDCIAEHKIPRTAYGQEKITECYRRRIFEPLGDHKYRLSYNELPSFLVAYWMDRHLPDEEIVRVFEQWKDPLPDVAIDVLSWLSNRRPKLVVRWAIKQPEAFLNNSIIIKECGVSAFLDRLLVRYEQLSWADRSTQIEQRLEVLRGIEDACAWSCAMLTQRNVCGHELVFAGAVARATGLEKTRVVAALVDVICRPSIDSRIQSEIAYDLQDILNEDRPDCLSRLKKVLLGLERGHWQETTRGCLLRLLWPRWLTTAELVEVLEVPFADGRILGHYDFFLNYEFPKTFPLSLNRENVVPLIKWASGHYAEVHPRDRLEDLARAIFTYAWTLADDEEVAKALAISLEGQDEHKLYQLPFLEDKQCENEGYEWMLSLEEYRNRQDLRLNVFKELVERNRLSIDILTCIVTPVRSDPILFGTDFPAVYKLWQAARHDEVIALRYAKALLRISWMYPLDEMVEERKRLLATYPDMLGFDADRVMSERKHWDAEEVKRKQRQSERESKLAKRKRQHEEGIQKHIREHVASADLYITMSYFVPSEDGRQCCPLADIREGVQWQNFDDEIKSKIFDSAKMVVKDHPINDLLGLNTSKISFASAVKFIWECDKCFFDTLSRERWGDVVAVLLSCSSSDTDAEFAENFILVALDRHRNVCASAVLRALSAELGDKYPTAQSLVRWGEHCTDSLIDKSIALGMVGGILDDERMRGILSSIRDVEKACGIEFPAVVPFFRRLIMDFNKFTIDHPRVVAQLIALRPQEYCKPYLDFLLEVGPDASRFLSMMESPDDDLLSAGFCNADIETAARMFVWVEEHFPRSEYKQPEGCYSPSSRDNIDEFVSYYLCSRLYETTDEKVVKILESHPLTRDNEYLQDVLKRTRTRVAKCHELVAVSAEEIERLSRYATSDPAVVTDSRVTVIGGVDQAALEQTMRVVVEPRFDKLDHDHKKQFNFLDSILGFMGIIRKNARFFNADRRFDGLEVLCQARRDQVRTAILHSWDNGYAVLPIQTDPKKRAANKGRPTISSLARIMWSENGSKWMLVPDCYQSEAAYKTGLIEQAQRNPLSFNWIED